MQDARKIVGITLSVISTGPLRGIVEVDAGDALIKFELTEETANDIGTLLDRFLTQKQRQKPSQAA